MTAESKTLFPNIENFRAAEAEIAMAIGRMVIRFNSLDRDLGQLLAALLESKNTFVGAALVASIGFSQKVDLLAALYLEKFKEDPAKCAECRTAIQKLRTIEEERNKYVHSCFGTSSFGSSEFLRTKPKTKGGKGLSFAREDVDVQAMKALVDRMSDFAFLDLVELYRGCVEPRV